MRVEMGKETAKKEMDLDVFYDVTHDTFRISEYLPLWLENSMRECKLKV